MKNLSIFFSIKILLSVIVISLLIPFSSFGATWQTVGNFNISWYNTSDKEFIISTSKELAGLAYIVNNGYANFQNKTIKLDNDIDLSDYEWEPIGRGTNIFKGAFNGQNHTISGLKITQKADSYPFYGLFSSLNGSPILNLKIMGNIKAYFADQSYPNTFLGALCGSAANCQFINIHTLVDISYERAKTITSSYKIEIGGVVGSSSKSNFLYCINEGNILVNFGREGINSEYYTDSSYSYIGGIVGNNLDSYIYCCGNINNKLESYFAGSKNASGMIEIGGIIGNGATSRTIISGCYNNALKFAAGYYGTSNARLINIGGIAGFSCYYNSDSGYISNNYSSTTLYLTNTTSFNYGGIIGNPYRYEESINKYTSNYSPNNITPNKNGNIGYNGATTFSRDQMIGNDFLEELNIYPILKNKNYRWGNDNEGFPYTYRSEDFSTGINVDKVEQASPLIFINHNNISFEYDVEVSLYSIEGNCVFKGITSSIPSIPTGLYIMRYGNKCRKIMVN